MKHASLLHGAALCLWGFAADHPLLGILLAAIRLAPTIVVLRLHLDDRRLERAVILTSVAAFVTVLAISLLRGFPAGLIFSVGWLPIPLLPLGLIGQINEAPIRWRHLSRAMARAGHPDADRPFDLDAPYLILTLFAGALLTKSGSWYPGLAALLIVLWLLISRPRMGTSLPAFAAAAVLACSVGYYGAASLRVAQEKVEAWVIDSLSDLEQDPDVRHTRIGSLGELKLSHRMVWRVEQAGPSTVPLLLRVSTYSRYGKGSWNNPPSSFRSPEGAGKGQSKPALTLLGEGRKGRLFIPLPPDAGVVEATGGVLKRNDLGSVQVEDGPPELKLHIWKGPPTSRPSEVSDLSIPDQDRRMLTALPVYQALLALGEREKLAALSAWFADNFQYSLYLGGEQSDRKDLAAFLSSSRSGHCEYFATATVLMLRALNIPARYVTGYSVSEYSRLEKAFVVRERHAHAWAEAYVDGRWVEVDNTPAVWADIDAEQASPLQAVSDVLDYLKRLARSVQAGLAVQAGRLPDWLGWSLLAGLFGGVAFAWRKKPRLPFGRKLARPDPEEEAEVPELLLFRALEKAWAARGLGRRPPETPQAWISRLEREGGSLVEEPAMASAREIVARLYLSRYSGWMTREGSPIE